MVAIRVAVQHNEMILFDQRMASLVFVKCIDLASNFMKIAYKSNADYYSRYIDMCL